MASFAKFTRSSVGRLFLHNNREQGDGVTHSNKDIDDTKTHLNKHYECGNKEDVRNRLKELEKYKSRKDGVVLGEWIVTLPKDVRYEDRERFFDYTHDFLVGEVGQKNVINAVVHYDESTPHLHFDFTPIIKKDGKEKLCCKEYSTRKYLAEFHPRLSSYVASHLGYEVEILNGATENGNRTVLQMKNERLEKDIERLEDRKRLIGNDITKFTNILTANNIHPKDLNLYGMMSEVSSLKSQIAVYKNILVNRQIPLTREDMDKLKTKTSLLKSNGLNILDMNLKNITIKDNAFIVFDCNNPNMPFLKTRPEAEVFYYQSKNEGKTASIKNGKDATYLYLNVAPNNQAELIAQLIAMYNIIARQKQYQDSVIYAEKIDMDDFDFLKNILESLPNESYYLVGRKITSDSRERQQTRDITKENS